MANDNKKSRAHADDVTDPRATMEEDPEGATLNDAVGAMALAPAPRAPAPRAPAPRAAAPSAATSSAPAARAPAPGAAPRPASRAVPPGRVAAAASRSHHAGHESAPLASHVADAAAAQLLLFDTLLDDEKPRQDDRVLLVGLVWGNETLVELEQIAKGGHLKVGEIFDFPSTDLPKNFRIVNAVGSELVFTIPANLNSEIHHSSGKGIDSLESLSRTGKAQRVEAPFSGYAYTVQSDDRIVVQIAPQLTLIARYVRAARAPDKGLVEMVDVSFTTTLLIAILALGLFWLIIQITPRFDDMLGDDLSRNQARFTQYQVKPEEKKPKFKELSGIKEGAKAKGDEGKFGKQDAKKKDADPSKKGAPIVDPNKKEKDRQTVMKSGLLAALSKLGVGAQGAASDVLGPGGLGTGINNALGGIKGGAGQGDAYGAGGLGSRGNGSGGGGTALGLGGLGTGGNGRGRGGNGTIDLGGRGKDETEFIPGKTNVIGGLSRDVINRIIQRHYNEIKYCYEKELTKDPGLYGKVAVLFVISGDGRVGDALVQQTTMSSETVESCMLNHIKRWVFPAPAGGGTVQVTYPYVFKASGQ